MNEWLIPRRDRRQLPVAPADRLRRAEVALAEAESRGDQQAVDEASRGIDDLFQEARLAAAEERAAAARAARFSSGARMPLRRKPSRSAQMNQAILQLTGRSR